MLSGNKLTRVHLGRVDFLRLLGRGGNEVLRCGDAVLVHYFHADIFCFVRAHACVGARKQTMSARRYDVHDKSYLVLSREVEISTINNQLTTHHER